MREGKREGEEGMTEGRSERECVCSGDGDGVK